MVPSPTVGKMLGATTGEKLAPENVCTALLRELDQRASDVATKTKFSATIDVIKTPTLSTELRTFLMRDH
jgi:hypothetical protein